jgi:hypothetical protein
MPVNRFLVNQTINGLCTAYFYVYSSEEQDSGGYPVLYADNGNKPLARQSTGESFIDLRVNTGKPAGWRTGTFQGSIGGGSYVWFGVSTEYFWYSRFDYGLKSYRDNNFDGVLPDTYPLYNANFYDNFKLSMYFEYSSAENYTRTLTQGVTLTDTASRFRIFFCTLTENIKISDAVTWCRDLLRTIAGAVRPSTGEIRKLEVKRGINAQAGTQDNTARQQGFIRTLLTAAHSCDYAGKVFTWLRVIHQQADIHDQTGRLGEYYRLQQDHVSTQALSLRHLIIFIRLVTVGFIRDYLIPRFLRSKEEMVLKSKVSRELELDSRIHA